MAQISMLSLSSFTTPLLRVFQRTLVQNRTRSGPAARADSGDPRSFIALALPMVACLLFAGAARGQVTVTNPGNATPALSATYPSLAAAITAWNATTAVSGPVTITLSGNETAPSGGFAITALPTGASATNNLVVSGSASTITAYGGQTSGNLNDAIFKIIGADFVTIQNFTIQENAANTTTNAASNNMTEWGVALLYASTTNGAQNCTIQNNTISLNRTYQNTFGIYSNSTHSATAPTTSATATTTAGGNSGLKIYGNAISNVNQGVVVIGPTAAADMNTGIDIGGSGPSSGNTITNFGTTGTFSSYANVSGTVYGILVRNSPGFNCSYNSITSSNGGVTSGTLRGIYNVSASNTPIGTYTNNINNNTIALTYGVASGTMQGITVEATNATTTSTGNINNNNFTALTASIASSVTITAISTVAPHFSVNVNNNTFTNLSTVTTGSFTFISHSYSIAAGGSSTVSNNSIVTGFNKTGAGGTVTCTTTNGSSPNGTVQTYVGNVFSNITVTGATGITGINNTDGAGTSPTKICTGNTLNNWVGGTSALLGINFGYIGAATSNISGNSLSNWSGQSTMTGIQIGSSFSGATTLNIANNTVNGLNSSGTGGTVIGITCSNASTTININNNNVNTLSSSSAGVTGIAVTGSTANNVFKNLVHDLSTANATSSVIGINLTAGTTGICSNNMVRLGTNTSTGAFITGINETGGTNNVYHNSVFIGGTATGGAGNSCAFSSLLTGSTRNRVDNIFVNARSNSGSTGKHYATREGGTTVNPAGLTSNYNVLRATGTGGFTGSFNGADLSTIGAWRTATGQDLSSRDEDPQYLAPTAVVPDLHIDPSIASSAEAMGTSIAAVTDDYDGQTRSGLTPVDIGADAGNFTGLPVCNGTPATSTITGSSPICSGNGTTLGLSLAYAELGITYQWQSSTTPGGPYTNLGTAPTQATGILGSTRYFIATVTCTNSGQSMTTAEFTLTVNPTPTATASSNSPACAGQPLNLTGTSDIGTSFAWTGPGGFTSGLQNPQVSASATTAMAGTYSFTASLNGCTSAPSNTAVSVVQAPVVTSTPSNAGLCAGGSTVLTASGSAQASLSSVLASLNTNSATIQAAIPTPAGFALDGSGGVNGNSITDGGCDMYDSPGNQLNTNLASGIQYSDNTIVNSASLGSGGQYFTRFISGGTCTGGTAALFFWAGDINGLTSLGITGDPGADGSGTQNITSFPITANGITYTAFIKRLFGAGDPSINHIFLIPTPNSVTQTMGASTATCNQTLSNLAGVSRFYYLLFAGAGGAQFNDAQMTAVAQAFANAIPSGALTYLWSPGGETTAAITVNAGGTYTVTGMANGCSAQASSVVTVTPPITSASITGSLSFCTGSNTTLTAVAGDGVGPYTYLWSPGGETTASIAVTAGGNYSCQVTDACLGSVNTGSVSVTEYAVPTASASSNSPVCEGQPLNLTGTSNIGTSFNWTGPAGFASTTQSPQVSAAATLAMGGVYTFTASANGCTSLPATTTVVVNAIPTGVTASASSLLVCPGGTVDLSSTGVQPASVILTQNFNGTLTGWTSTNTGTGGTIANADWGPRANGFSYSSAPLGGTFSSNDASQFYMTNSDAQGSGSTTATTLVSPAFSLVGYTSASVNFFHFYRDIGDTGDSAVVEVSTNGTSWTIAQAFVATAGLPAGFVSASVPLNAYIGQPSVQVRFRYRATWDWYWCIDNLTVSAAALPTFSWSSTPSGFTSGSQNPAGVTVGQSTTYSVTVTTTAGCSASANITVNMDNTDTDNDGTTDCTDGCPNDPLKIAPGACGCGAADVPATWYADADNDGAGDPNSTVSGFVCLGPPAGYVANSTDQCPADGSKTSPGACGCGVADTDTDNDGTADCIDGCPADPNKITPGQCGCGVADTDTDSDGTADCNDLCPADPNKVAPGACGCGVADTDTDADGTPDCNDQCPADPNKTTPGLCGCGVVDVDLNNNNICDSQEAEPTVQLGIVENPTETLELRLLPNGPFYELVSSTVVTVRWITTPGVSLNGGAAVYADPNWVNALGSLLYVGTATDGIYSYASFATFGVDQLQSVGLNWAPNVEVPFFRVPVVNTSGACVNFEVTTDPYQVSSNSQWYIALNGLDMTDGFIAGETSACVGQAAVQITAKAFLEGPFVVATGRMSDGLRTGALAVTYPLIPSAQPYSIAPWNYAGTESVAPSVLTVTGDNAIVDWVLLEVRDAVTSSTIVARRAALIQRDGDIVDVDGTSPVTFVGLLPGNYHLAVRHRNHLGVMTFAPIAMNGATTLVDFTLTSTATYGTSAQKTIGTVQVMWAGNVVADNAIKYTGTGNDRDPILTVIGGSLPTNTVNGYLRQDVTLNGQVKYTGTLNDRDPILTNIGGSVPTSVRLEQLP